MGVVDSHFNISVFKTTVKFLFEATSLHSQFFLSRYLHAITSVGICPSIEYLFIFIKVIRQNGVNHVRCKNLNRRGGTSLRNSISSDNKLEYTS